MVVTMMNNMTIATAYDVVVIGGGAAGLSGALTLARSRRSVLVIDAGQPRNAPAAGVHGLLTRDGMNPQALLEVGRAEVRGYGGHIVDGRVTSASRDGASFTVSLADGRVGSARRLLVTTGLSTSYRRCRVSASAGGVTCCTARIAMAGRSATRRSAFLPPGHAPFTRRYCFAN
jgi:thioredoxin reductase